MQKIIKTVLSFLSDGEKPKYKVTYRIKSYKKDEVKQAFDYMSKHDLIVVTNAKAEFGRPPKFVSITDEGRKYLSSLDDNSNNPWHSLETKLGV